MTTKKPEVTKLPIYKSLLPRIRKQDRSEFKRMLEIAAENYIGNCGYFGQSERLRFAFRWMNTPQGYDYWNELHERLRAAGHGDVA